MLGDLNQTQPNPMIEAQEIPYAWMGYWLGLREPPLGFKGCISRGTFKGPISMEHSSSRLRAIQTNVHRFDSFFSTSPE